MQRLRAALLGCLLAGGVLFGPRPLEPRERVVRPVVFSSQIGPRDGVSPHDRAGWFRSGPFNLTVDALRAQAGLVCGNRPVRSFDWREVLETEAGTSRDVPPITSVPRARIRCIHRIVAGSHSH